MKNQRRSIRFLFPAIQNRFFTLALAGIGVSLTVQAVVGVTTLTTLARELPHDGHVVQAQIAGILVRNFLWSFVLTAPAFGFFVLAALMRVIGPFDRMQRFLEDLIDGRRPEACHLRDGDEFHEFCALLNRATGVAGQGEDTDDARRAA